MTKPNTSRSKQLPSFEVVFVAVATLCLLATFGFNWGEVVLAVLVNTLASIYYIAKIIMFGKTNGVKTSRPFYPVRLFLLYIITWPTALLVLWYHGWHASVLYAIWWVIGGLYTLGRNLGEQR